MSNIDSVLVHLEDIKDWLVEDRDYYDKIEKENNRLNDENCELSVKLDDVLGRLEELKKVVDALRGGGVGEN